MTEAEEKGKRGGRGREGWEVYTMKEVRRRGGWDWQCG